MEKKYTFNDLVEIMKKLRSPKGCPWDQKQTHESLVPYLIEETYELVDAIKEKDYENMKEELGDLLLQVVFHSQIAKERGKFNISDVVDSIAKKLVFRHPHVFGDRDDIKNSEDVLREWDKLKEKEGKKRESLLDGIPKSLPPIPRAYKLQKRVEKVGFDWSNYSEIREKLVEELKEIDDAVKKGKKEKIEEEIGDLFFMVVNLARFLDINPEIALQKANDKFEKRFRYIEEEARKKGKKLEEMSLEEMEELWQEAKKKML
ncbi:MazG family protein [Desulfurobacterium thermolithotrophum DSM 11699]|uniref:Nucleoside triphosphate pyrophosphohydrolase n=1 Tax=Desulfurobacterium thermolithotrophum (strain DSM 11699 / BSA) TaxID=868864 RepID=F0S183_DESTD|nr:nucleoside triphosphate pyrophosphohydrolase [Desulfurobacterium thermolithotrophum]ADY73961.1 MazG family protein [Desulfurobacterium thermolithotrophum DSM 11699]